MRVYLALFISVFLFSSCANDESSYIESSISQRGSVQDERFEKLGSLIYQRNLQLSSDEMFEIPSDELEKEALYFYNTLNEIKADFISTGGDKNLFHDFFIDNIISAISSKLEFDGMSSYRGGGCWSAYLAGLSNCSGNYLADLAACPGSPFLNYVCVTGTYAQFVQCSTIEYNSFRKCVKRVQAME